MYNREELLKIIDIEIESMKEDYHDEFCAIPFDQFLKAIEIRELLASKEAQSLTAMAYAKLYLQKENE